LIKLRDLGGRFANEFRWETVVIGWAVNPICCTKYRTCHLPYLLFAYSLGFLEIAVAFVDLGEFSQKAFDLDRETFFDPELIDPTLEAIDLHNVRFFR
jgi:hypothetical protein